MGGRGGGGVGRRVLALGLGVLAIPVLIEVALQLGALFVGGSRAGGDALDGASLVLCQGDSNTYGFNLDARHAYPAQLEGLLVASGVADARVVNRGVPGKPTWVLLEELPGDLERFAPRALVVLCGLNDRNMLRPEDGASRLFSKLRTVNLVRRLIAAEDEGDVTSWAPTESEKPNILTHRSLEKVDDETDRVHFVDRSESNRPFTVRRGTTEPDVYREWIASDLAQVAQTARAAGAVPFFCAYPLDAGPFEVVNQGIVLAAERSGARLVDPRPSFARGIELIGRDPLVFPDGHPTALGYAVIARHVLRALVEQGVVDVEAPGDPLEVLAEWKPPELALELLRDEGRVRGVLVRYDTGYRVQLMLSGARGTTKTRWRGVMYPVDDPGEGMFEVPLARDALFEAAWRDGRYLVPFDDVGEVTIELAPEAAGGDGPLWGSAVIEAPGSRIVTIGEPFELR